MVGQVRSGFITNRDREWFQNEEDGYDQKYALKRGVAQVMYDIEELLNIEFEDISEPAIEGISELFQYIEEDDKLTREECARNLISLAFIITNEPIDYSEIIEKAEFHPRDENSGEMPRSKGRKFIGGRKWDYPVDDILSFRNALSGGIHDGKSRIDGQEDEIEIPEVILISSNTKLYKEPTVDRLRSDFNAETWRDALSLAIDTGNHPDIQDRNLDTLSQDKAIELIIGELSSNVRKRLAMRRHLSDTEVYDEYVF